MTYKPFQPKKEKKKGKRMIFFIAVLFMALFTFFPSLFNIFSSFSNQTAVPVWNAGETANSGFSNIFSLFRSKQALVKKNTELTAKVADLEAKLGGYDFVIQENIEMKARQFGYPEKYIHAKVISRPNVSAYDTILIDRGSTDNIKKGAKIVSGNTYLLGVIEEVYPHSSKGRLFSSFGSVNNAFLGPENIPVEIHGMGGGFFSVEVPKDVDIRDGDAAVFSDDPELILAIVKKKEKDSMESFQTFYLQNPIALFTVKYVDVEKVN